MDYALLAFSALFLAYVAIIESTQPARYGSITAIALIAGFEELLGPTVIEVLGDALLAADLGDAVLTAKTFEDDADLLLGREVPPGGSPDVSDGPSALCGACLSRCLIVSLLGVR